MELAFTKNFYNYLGCIFFGGENTNGTAMPIGGIATGGWGYPTSNSNLPCSLTDVSGNAITGMNFSMSLGSPNPSWNHSFFVFNDGGQGTLRPLKFICGSGSTTPTINDTALVTPNNNITATIETGERDTETSLIFTVTFSAATEQVLNEVGLQRTIVTSSSAAGDKVVLFARGVFDTPITLDANTSKTMQIRLALPVPTA